MPGNRWGRPCKIRQPLGAPKHQKTPGSWAGPSLGPMGTPHKTEPSWVFYSSGPIYPNLVLGGGAQSGPKCSGSAESKTTVAEKRGEKAQALELRKHIHGDTRGIMVSFKETIGNRLVTVPIEQLAHDATRLPLAQAIYLLNKVLFAEATRGAPPPQQQTRPPTPPPSEAENVPSWGIDQEFESARLPGEDTGEWLCSDAVMNKHIDVLIQGIKSFGGSNKMKATPKLMTLEGNIGIVMSNAKRRAVSLKLKKIDVFCIGPPAGKQQLMEPVPGPYLRPLRTNNDGTSITTTQGRVVVLGPDVQGNASAVGQYGETQPLIPHDHGQYVVAVRFPGAGHCFYHVLHLCRSLNELAYCGDGTFPVTVF
ncbi:hypothetical protein FB451DRAFT_1169424 [Mycena latifolia]|nr:hypothetical protein FB451DRAFT_1169424 [Mycena latifolia]